MWKPYLIFVSLVAFATIFSLKMLVVISLILLAGLLLFIKFHDKKIVGVEPENNERDIEREIADFSRQIDQFSEQDTKKRAKLFKQSKHSGS